MALFNKSTGFIKFLKLITNASDPLGSDKGLYANAGGELVYKDGAANIIPLTSGGFPVGSGGFASFSVDRVRLTSEFNISNLWSDVAGGNMTEITGLSITKTITSTDAVQLIFHGVHSTTSATDNGTVYGYQLDSATPVTVGYDLIREDTSTKAISFTKTLTGLTPGDITFKITASKIASATHTIRANSNLSDTYFEVVILRAS